MTRVLWLGDYAAEEGCRVVEIPGWEKRGLDGLRPGCVVCHHIGILGGGNAPGLGVVTHGRAGLRNALCNGHLARDGTVSIVASGVAWHAGKGGYRGLTGNSSALGIEAEGTTGEAMPSKERDAYERLVAGWLRGLEREEGWACAHHHWRAEKPDAWALLHPAGEWDRFVAAVGARLADEVEGWLMALSDEEQEQLRDDVKAIRSWVEAGVPGFGVPPARETLAALHWEVLGVPPDKDGKNAKPSLREKMTYLRDTAVAVYRNEQPGSKAG